MWMYFLALTESFPGDATPLQMDPLEGHRFISCSGTTIARKQHFVCLLPMAGAAAEPYTYPVLTLCTPVLAGASYSAQPNLQARIGLPTTHRAIPAGARYLALRSCDCRVSPQAQTAHAGIGSTRIQACGPIVFRTLSGSDDLEKARLQTCSLSGLQAAGIPGAGKSWKCLQAHSAAGGWLCWLQGGRGSRSLAPKNQAWRKDPS